MSRGPTIDIWSESGTMVLADCSTFTFEQSPDGILDVAFADAPSGTYKAGDIASSLHIRHVGGSNVAYADGHVAGLSPQRLFAEVPPPQE